MNAETLSPAPQRIEELDVLRGIALAGILFMNLAAFNDGGHWNSAAHNTAWPAWWDRAALWIHRVLFAGKFNGLLSFVFGIGFALLMERLSREPGGTVKFVRRMAVLFVLGITHSVFLFSGDVLQLYALLGLVLLGVRTWSDRALLVLTACLLLAPLAYVTTMRYAPASVGATMRAVDAPVQRAAARRNVAGMPYREGTMRRWDFTVQRFRSFIFYFTSIAEFGATVLMGFLVGRRGWPATRAWLTSVRRWVLPLLLTGWLLAVTRAGISAYIAGLPRKPPGTRAPDWLFWTSQGGIAAGESQRVLLTVAYASLVLWLLQCAHSRRWPRWFAAVGRTPLTTYIGQSMICATLFYGLGLAGHCGPALSLLVAPLIGALLAAFSSWWLRHHCYGPLEWVWRTAANGYPPRVSIGTGAVALAAGSEAEAVPENSAASCMAQDPIV